MSAYDEFEKLTHENDEIGCIILAGYYSKKQGFTPNGARTG